MFTDKLFTGQREMAGLGIYHYGARFYSPKLGRFLSADSIVPGYANPQNLNRYSYVINNPLRYTDPSGHRPVEEQGGKRGCSNATYCRNGQPKPADELAKMRKKPNGKGNGGGPTTPATTPSVPDPNPGSGGSGGGGGVLPSPLPMQGGSSTGGQDDSCKLTPSYLCQLPEEDQDSIASGQYYVTDVTSDREARHRNGIYGVLIALPTVIIPTHPVIVLLAAYTGSWFSSDIAKLPGTQEGDIMVSVGHAVGQEFVYQGHTYNTEVITSTYYFRDNELIWTKTQVTTAHPTTRTY